MNDQAMATLGRMAARGTLEVEHLLRAARQPSLNLADRLDELAVAMSWRLDSRFPEVPWAKWVSVVGIYCRQGHAGLLETANEPDMLAFVLGLLEELKTDEALSTIIRISNAYQAGPLMTSEHWARVVSALNAGANKGSRYSLSEAERVAARDFLHNALALLVTDHHRGAVLCALRYFGDDTSLPLIASSPPLPSHWETARRAAVRGIKKALNQHTLHN